MVWLLLVCSACLMLAAFFSSWVCLLGRTRSKAMSSMARAVMPVSFSVAWLTPPNRRHFLRSAVTCRLAW